jgi:RNA polymerase-binding transcription factor DksA
MARPIASLSVDAQERHEKKEKVHKDEWFQSHSNN